MSFQSAEFEVPTLRYVYRFLINIETLSTRMRFQNGSRY